MLEEVRRADGQAGDKDERVAESNADALREEDLPIFRAQRRHQEADGLDDGAGDEDKAEEAGVRCAARQGGHEKGYKDLHAPDPGDGAGRLVQGRGIVGLKEAEAVDEAPCAVPR